MKLSISSYFVKIIVFSLCLGAIPIIGVGIFSYYISTNSAQEKVNESNRNILDQTQNRVEQLLELIDTMTIQLINSSFINSSLNYPYPINNVDLIYQIDRGLKQIQLYQLEIEDVTFYNLEQRWYVNNKGFHVLEPGDLSDQLRSAIQDSRTSIWQPATAPASSRGNDLLLFKKIPINSFNPQGMLVIRISSNKIQSLISNSGIVIFNERLEPIYEDNDMPVDPDGIRRIVPDSAPGQFESKGNVWMYSQSSYNKWTYASVVSIASMTKESKQIGWVTVGFCLCFFGLTILFSLLVSFNIYSPVRSVYRLFKMNGREEGSVNEMEMIKENIRHLFESESALKAKLYQQSSQFKEQLMELFVRRLFNGGLKAKEIEESFAQFGQRISWKRWSVMMLQIDSFDETPYRMQDFDLIMFAVNNIVCEIIPSDRKLMPIIVDRSHVTLVGSRDGNESVHKKEVYRFAEEIQAKVMHYLRLKISIGISCPHQAFTDVPSAYTESIEALKYRIRIGSQAILFMEDVQPQANVHSVFPVRTVDALVDAMKDSDLDSCEELLGEIMRDIFGVARPQSEYQIMLTRVMVELIKVVESAGGPLHEVINKSDSLFDVVLKLNSPDEIKHWLVQDVIEPIASYLNERSKRHTRKIADQIVELIHQRYDSDLTLEDCAKQLNYSASYIKKIIRNELDITFTDYLNQYRLEISKQWLVDTDMRVSEIAERLKYNNAQNFIRYFKKLEGTTPGKYREQSLARKT